LVLDAKGMDVKEVAVVKNGKNTSVKFTNDGMTLTVALDKSYVKNENYTIYISYVAKPNEYKGTGSAAITDAKGLYFINPMGAEKKINLPRFGPRVKQKEHRYGFLPLISPIKNRRKHLD